MTRHESNHGSDLPADLPDPGWNNTLPQAIAECLRDREEPEADLTAEWLHEHEDDDVVWTVLNQMFDQFQQLANSAERTHDH